MNIKKTAGIAALVGLGSVCTNDLYWQNRIAHLQYAQDGIDAYSFLPIDFDDAMYWDAVRKANLKRAELEGMIKNYRSRQLLIRPSRRFED